MKNPAFQQNFYKQVLLQLREMLHTMKQRDTPANRSKFTEHCQQLLGMGTKANLTEWVDLLTTAIVAINNPENAYRPCAQMIVKEVKDAGEAISKGNTENIAASQQLRALATPPMKKTIPSEAPWEELIIDLEKEKDQTTYDTDPWEAERSTIPKPPELQELDPNRTIPSPGNAVPDNEFIDLFNEAEVEENPQTQLDQLQELDILETEDPIATTEDIEGIFDDFYNNDTQTGQEDESEDEPKDLVTLSDLNKEKPAREVETKPEPITANERLDREQLSKQPVYFYTQFAELDQLLEESPILTTRSVYAQLESLLELAPTKITEKQPDFATIRRLPPVKAATGRAAKANRLEQTMRVPIKQLDNLNNLIGELVVKRNRLEEDQDRLRQFLDNLLSHVQKLSEVNSKMQYLHERNLLERAILAGRNQHKNFAINYLPQADTSLKGEPKTSFNAFEMDNFNEFDPLAQDIIELIVRTRESASDIEYLVDETDQVARSLRQVTTSLQESLNNSRMVTFSTSADRMLRGVREVSLKIKKKVEVVVEGREVLVDKMILDQLYNPLTHLANNSVTHGIELPEVRRSRGKSPTGEIRIKAFIQGNQTLISVADDGAGIDVTRVKEKAIEKGLISRDKAKNMVNQEVYELLFHPGFSTKDKADDFSGRGVGLDVVRTSLQPIRGTVSIDSVLGKGTNFTIRLPLTLSICKALPCLSNNARIAFPIDGVEDTKDYRPDDIRINDQGQKCILWNNQLLPFQPLNSLLSYNRQISRSTIYGGREYDDTLSIVVLRGAGSLLAIQVDKIFPEQEIVIKQIEGPIPKPAGIAGATVLGDGRIMPIGDVMELIEIAQGRRSIAHNLVSDTTYSPQIPKLPQSTEPVVLIVDDSITVRQLLSLTFNKAGYRVEEAKDGQEAWEKLRAGLPCDLVFCDMEMPRMNGINLLSAMQQDPKLRGIPVGFLTSRGGEKHRKAAADLGASGYLTKPCTDRDLIDSAQRMIAGEKPIGIGGSSSSATTTQTGQKPAMIVLVIDDSVVVREMLSITFKKSGYRVEQARDGQEAWEKLRGGLPCQIIFCDIEMPRMNGLELLSRLQEDDKLKSIPVAMITSRGAERHRRIAAELGAKAYFTKPYIEEQLLDAAKRMIQGEVFLTEVEV